MPVVDSSVLILLSRVGKLSLLKHLDNVVVPTQVYEEVVEDCRGRAGVLTVKEACGEWIKVVELKSDVVRELSSLEGIGDADASIILLARDRRDVLVTNDRVLIQVARSMGVECWWLTTLLLKLVKEENIAKKEAEKTLLDLVEAGMRLRVEVYAAMLKEIERM